MKRGKLRKSVTMLAASALVISAVAPAMPVNVKADTQESVIFIKDAHALSLGTKVTVQGRVTAKLKNAIAIQDKTGGISVRPTSLAINEGELVTVTGTLTDYKGLLQLDKATVVTKDTTTIEVPMTTITGENVGEDYESQLVKVADVTLTKLAEGNGWINYEAIDATGKPFIVRDERGTLGLMEGIYKSITGVVQQFDNDYQVILRSSADAVFDSEQLVRPVATPAGGTFIDGTTVTLTATTANASIFYTFDDIDPRVGGATAAIKYENPIEITESKKLKATVKRNDADEYSDVIELNYEIKKATKSTIHDIQGATHNSLYNNQAVTDVKGIVTSTYELSGDQYYTIQTPDDEIDNDPRTSEGILLYGGPKATAPKLEVGNLISVKGLVFESATEGYDERQTTDLLTTQINISSAVGGKVTVEQSNVPLPTPIIIDENNLPTGAIDSDNLTVFNPETDAIDFWESLESMRVQVSNVKAVGPQANGDLTTVLESKVTNTKNGGVLLQKDNKNPDIIQFRLEPNGDARKFAVATGDKFVGDIVGVVGYSYQNYKIYAPLTDMKAAFVKGSVELEKTHIVKDSAKLTVGSYNLENFSNNKSKTSDDKAQKLARAFVKDLNSPDIVGVTEVQDNDGDINNGNAAANESYERLINEIVKAGGVEYKYANIDPNNNADGGAPGANIRVGVLYNPERVQLSDIAAGDATTAVGYENGNLTVNPGRIDPQNDAFKSSRKPLAAQFEFNGEKVIIIVNHWNSKNGDDALYGSKQPVVNKSEVQRKNIATIVEGFINDVKTKNPKANIVAVGDFNDFQFADSVKILENRHMTNMINHLPEEDRYSYVFQGNSQVLDHILVSNNLAKATEIDAIHINADFTDMAGRASDHDPILAQIDVKAANTEPKPDGGNNPGNGGSNPGNGGGNNSGGGNAGGGTTAPETKPEEKPETEKPEIPQPEEQEKPAPFTPTDLPANHWAAGYIEKMIEKGLLKGNEKGEVKPDANVTRAQLASILARALSLKADGQAPFSDVSKYAPATQAEIAAIFEAGIAKGVDGQFNPSGETTRAQFALMLYRAYEHVTGEKYTPKGDATFSDLGQYNEETRAAIAMIQELGIATGDNGKFKPTAPATRAHTAKMVINFLEVIESR